MGKKEERVGKNINEEVITLRKTREFLKNSTFFLVIVICCWCILQISYNQAPSFFGYRILRIVSDSMFPVITKDECIITKKVTQEELKVGDIISFQSSDPTLYRLYNTHRIVDIVKDTKTGRIQYITKGDNAVNADSRPVNYEQIIGRYHTKLLGGKKVSAFLRFIMKKQNYFCFIILPLTFCVMECLMELIKEIKNVYKEKGEQDEKNN